VKEKESITKVLRREIAMMMASTVLAARFKMVFCGDQDTKDQMGSPFTILRTSHFIDS
jgi:hypothetical protein